MKNKIINVLAVILGIALATSLMNGAGVIDTGWPGLPVNFSRFTLLLLCTAGCIYVFKKVLIFIGGD